MIGLRQIYISVALAVTAVGLAQFYNGNTLRGLRFFIAFLLVSFGNIGGAQYHALLFFRIWIAAACEGVFYSV